MPKVNEIELIASELKRPPSRRRKKILKIVNWNYLLSLESEIIKINYYLAVRIISDKSYRPHDEDEDQPLREKVQYLMKFRDDMKKLLNPRK